MPLTCELPYDSATIIEARVEAGAAFLDDTVPGWAGRINRAELWMGSCRECVLGQLFGGFVTGSQMLELKGAQELWMGFNLADMDEQAPATYSHDLWKYLNDCWVEQITHRLTK